MPSFLTESGVNPKGVPFVIIRSGIRGQEGWQFTPEEAREFALVILGAAEAALHDAAFVRWLQEGPLGLDFNRAVRMLGEQRQYRADLDV